MSNHCCREDILNNPCQAIQDGNLTHENYVNYGLNLGQYLLLIAQCGTTQAVNDLVPILNQLVALATASLAELVAINANTDGIETQLDTIITLLNDGNATAEDILTAVEAILVEVEAININTDGIEALLTTMVTLLTTISTDVADIEVALNQVLLNQINPSLFGPHVILSGTQATAPAAGLYSSYLIVRTNGVGTLTVAGITLNNQGDSTADESQPQFKIPAPVIAVSGGAEYEWRTKS